MKAGPIHGLKAGRRLLIPFKDLDRYTLSRLDRSAPGRHNVMATIHRPTRPDEAGDGPLVPPISPEELARRNREAVALLDSWEAEGDEEEQRETMAVLREALGKRRTLSSRPLFP